MQRVSLRTLILMVELLVAIVALQYVALAKPAKADAIWLAGDGLVAAPAPAARSDGTSCCAKPANAR